MIFDRYFVPVFASSLGIAVGPLPIFFLFFDPTGYASYGRGLSSAPTNRIVCRSRRQCHRMAHGASAANVCRRRQGRGRKNVCHRMPSSLPFSLLFFSFSRGKRQLPLGKQETVSLGSRSAGRHEARSTARQRGTRRHANTCPETMPGGVVFVAYNLTMFWALSPCSLALRTSSLARFWRTKDVVGP